MPLARANPPLKGRVGAPIGRRIWPKPRLILPTAAHKDYIDRVLATNPIAYWPLDEKSGTVARCRVNPAQNALYPRDVSAMTIAEGIGDGNTAPHFNGTSDKVNLLTSALQSAWNGAECTIMGWAKVHSTWDTSDWRDLFYCNADGDNWYRILKLGANNLYFWTEQNNVPKGEGIATTTVEWFQWAITSSVSGDFQRYYKNGVEDAELDTGLGTWAGTLAEAWIGATVSANFWYGWECHVAIWDSAQTGSIIAELAEVG